MIVCAVNGVVSIDWKAVNSAIEMIDPGKPADDVRLNLQVSESSYLGSVITPWYRGCMDQVRI